jgi:hypothetical protein
MHSGDLFPQKMFPLIDTMNGGSALDYPKTLAKEVDGIKNVDTVIPGHRQVGSWNEFKEYAAFIQDMVSYARSAVNARKTVAQAAAEYKVPAKYKDYVVTIDPQLITAERIFQTVYDELKP